MLCAAANVHARHDAEFRSHVAACSVEGHRIKFATVCKINNKSSVRNCICNLWRAALRSGQVSKKRLGSWISNCG